MNNKKPADFPWAWVIVILTISMLGAMSGANDTVNVSDDELYNNSQVETPSPR